jgi:hypothetical protein
MDCYHKENKLLLGFPRIVATALLGISAQRKFRTAEKTIGFPRSREMLQFSFMYAVSKFMKGAKNGHFAELVLQIGRKNILAISFYRKSHFEAEEYGGLAVCRIQKNV